MKNIGVFCSDNNVFCVERAANKFGKMFFVEGLEETASRRQGPTAISVTSDVLTQFSQQFEKQGFKTSQINLALPSRDIIFRSFIIPWMPSHEIKNVVDYEIDKYLPFDKSELKYSFHDIKFVQDNTRKIRIVFIGIKKLSLSQYIDRFKQIGLEVKLVEPADISLIQTLASFGEIPPNETVTLVKKHGDRGKLMIIDQGIPLFVREFSFSSLDAEPGAMVTRLVNEVRISLDYFTRQDQQFTCKKILFLSSLAEPAIVAALEDSLTLPVKSIEADRLFPEQLIDNIEYLNAFGIGLKNSFGLTVDFNAITDESGAKDVAVSPGEEKKREMVANIAVAIVSLLLIIGGFFLPNFLSKDYHIQFQEIESQMSGAEHKATADLEAERGFFKEKMGKFKNTRLSSEAAYFLKTIPELLPKGVWLDDFDLSYKNETGSETVKGSLELSLFGNSYAEDSATQFKLVNMFLNKMRSDKKFMEYFESIDLNSMNTEDINSYPVTRFKITCH